MKIKSINPATEEVVKEYDLMGKADVERKVANATKVFDSWKETSLAERTKLVKRVGKKLTARKQHYAEIITKEMGKPLKESIPEIEKCAWLCEYYSRHAKNFLREETIKTEYKKSKVVFQPLGVVASIMPWNFPFWQPLRFAIPAIIAGNVEILKPSSTTPGSGIAIHELFEKCKFPENVFQVVIGDSTTGEALVQADINAVSVTGSAITGAKIAKMAMQDLKKVVLELGGSDPFVVLNDADLEKAVEGAIAGRFLNCGQSCIAAKRFIVMKDVVGKFTEMFVLKAKELKVGNPMEADTDIGPLVRESQRQEIERQIKESVAQGAKILLGGKRVDGKGYFFEPTILDATNDMTISKEEAFGPAAPIIAVESEEDAIRIANNTEYGLGASLWTQNLEKGEQITRKINSGLVFVNKHVRSDPRLPFGGVKKSGIGRELSRHGLLEMVNIKTVIIN